VNVSGNTKKANCINRYDTLGEEQIKVIYHCKSKRAFTELRRESCVSFGVYWCELWTETRCVIFVRPAVNYCHYACGSTTVTVRSIDAMYRYLPSLPKIYNYHPPASLILILPHNITCCSTEIKGQTPKPSLSLYSYITVCTGRWVKILTV
jgi:hypothetical protein